jgi:hypothetical protein
MEKNVSNAHKENQATDLPALEQKSTAPKKVNILTIGNETPIGISWGAILKVVRLDDNETAVIPFTPDGERVAIHYLEEPDFRGYIQCNGKDCILCRVGRKVQAQILIPVFLPASQEVSILAASTTMRPKSLLPQLQNVLKGGQRMVLFIRRDRDAYTISSRNLPPDVADGTEIIRDFVEAYRNNQISLAHVFPLLTNEQLANLPGVASMRALKGLKA